MKNLEEIKQVAIETINVEAETISKLVDYIDDDFAKAVKAIYNSKGRAIITGIGKSANIAKKIVATLNSTGTPAIFMHAADAIHGDLGIIQKDDVVVCISKSGNTPEIKVLVPLIKNFGNVLIGMVSNTDSFLGKQSDFVLNAKIEKEACPNNLAPTSSSTAQLVIGDALAVSLLDYRNFSERDFAKYHPGGALGKSLYMRIKDMYYLPQQNPSIYVDETLDKAIVEISSKLVGATVVLNRDESLAGIITDGDIRRVLQKHTSINHIKAAEIMCENPKTIDIESLAIVAFNAMKKSKIMQMIVTENDKYLGIVHLHNILMEGIV